MKALANSANVRASCQAAGITRDCAYRARKRNKKFAKDWLQALADSCDILEATAWARATQGVTKEHSHYFKGALVGKDIETEYSDGLLMFLLKAHRPKKFRERIDVKHKGKGGIPLAMMGPLSVTFETVNERPLESPPEAGPAPGGA